MYPVTFRYNCVQNGKYLMYMKKTCVRQQSCGGRCQAGTAWLLYLPISGSLSPTKKLCIWYYGYGLSGRPGHLFQYIYNSYKYYIHVLLHEVYIHVVLFTLFLDLHKWIYLSKTMDIIMACCLWKTSSSTTVTRYIDPTWKKRDSNQTLVEKASIER